MQKGNKRKLYISLIILMNIVVIYLIFRALKNGVNGNGEVIAYVDNKPVYREEVQTRLDAFLSNANMQEKVELESFPDNFVRAVVLEVHVGHKLDKLAKKENFDKDEEIQDMVNTYRNKLMREKFIKDVVMANVDDKAIKDRYAELTASLEGKEERKVKHILVKDESEARRVRRNILRTGNFERFAREKSIDSSTAQNGGDLGYILKEEMVSEFGDVAFLLKKGELSKPVQTRFGWHILKVEDIREAKPLPFEQVKGDIENRLKQEALQQYLKDLTDEVDTELLIETGKGVPDKKPQVSEESLDNVQEETNEDKSEK